MPSKPHDHVHLADEGGQHRPMPKEALRELCERAVKDCRLRLPDEAGDVGTVEAGGKCVLPLTEYRDFVYIDHGVGLQGRDGWKRVPPSVVGPEDVAGRVYVRVSDSEVVGLHIDVADASGVVDSSFLRWLSMGQVRRWAQVGGEVHPACATVDIPRGHRYPDSFYEQVSEAYIYFAVTTDRPAAALAEANGVPTTTVHRWIKEARRRGLHPAA